MKEEYKELKELQKRYLTRLSDLYPTIAAASTEIINLQAILNLPKGTEHFLTDVHGEYEAFSHVLKNGSGSVRRKIEDVFGNTMSAADKKSLATLIYYPRAKMDLIRQTETNMEDWYHYPYYHYADCQRCARNKGGRPDTDTRFQLCEGHLPRLYRSCPYRRNRRSGNQHLQQK